MVIDLRRLFKEKNPGIPDTDKNMRLLDAMNAYRNRVFHGGAALSSRVCESRVPVLLSAIENILLSLKVIKTFEFYFDQDLHIKIHGEILPIMPMANQNSAQIIAIMEGYNSKKKSIRFVSSEGEWECEEHWFLWETLLQQRGLLPMGWNNIDEAWLSRRAHAMVPSIYQPPAGFFFDADVYGGMRKCIDQNGVLWSNDTLLATMCYLDSTEKLCFILPSNHSAWEMGPYDGLSYLFGFSHSIEQLPVGHALESLLQKVAVIALPGSNNREMSGWLELESEFPGMEVITIKQGSETGRGYCFTDKERKRFYQFYSQAQDIALNWNDIPQQYLEWADDTEKIIFLIEHINIVMGGQVMPAAIWFEYLKETFGSKIDANQHRELLRACSDLIGVVNTHSFTVLQDLGLLHLSGDGSPIFTNEWARAGLYQYILFSSDGRPRRRFASEPPLPLTQQIGEALWHEDKRSCLNFASGAKGAAVLFAIKIMKDPQFITELDEGGCEKTLIFSVSSLLVSWRHPELADSLLSNYWDFISDEVVDAEEDVLAVASSVRSYGSAELAIKIFQSIAGRESICGI